MPFRVTRRALPASTLLVLATLAPAACRTSAEDDSLGSNGEPLTGDGGDATVDGTGQSCTQPDLSASVMYAHDKTDAAEAFTDWNDGIRLFASPFALTLPASLPVTAGNADDGYALVDLTRADGGHVRCTYVAGDARLEGAIVASTSHAWAGNIAVGSTGAAAFRLTNRGASAVTLTTSTPPTAAAFVVAGGGIPSGTVLAAGASIVGSVTFAPVSLGAVHDVWSFVTSEGVTFSVSLDGMGASSAAPSPLTGGWSINGSAALLGGADAGSPATALRLTPAETVDYGNAGTAFWPTALTSSPLTVSFDSYMGEGFGGGDGTTMLFADPAHVASTSVGWAAYWLGFIPLKGIAVTLDTDEVNTPYLPRHFLGVSDGTVDPNDPFTDIHWPVKATNIPPLREVRRHVTVQVSNGDMRVSLDGLEALHTTVSLTPTVLLGFTGATGGWGDVHDVSNVSISADPIDGDAGTASSASAFAFAACDDGVTTPGTTVSVAGVLAHVGGTPGDATLGMSLGGQGGTCDAGTSDSGIDSGDGGACVNESLVAVQSFASGAPPTVTHSISPHTVKFAIPSSVPILAGSTTHTEAWLQVWTGDDPAGSLVYPAQAATTCHYVVDTVARPTLPADGTAHFISCDDKSKVGKVIKADHFAAGITVSAGAPYAAIDFEIADQTTCKVADAGADAAGDATTDAAGDASDTGADVADAGYDASDAGGDANDAAPACTAAQCDDGNVCTTDGCNPDGTCAHVAMTNGTACSDGNACTQTDSCQAGVCTGASPVTCTATDSCHTAGTCDPSSGACSNPVAPNGTTCSDGNNCTTGDVCTSGTCGGSAVSCAASDACHVAGTCISATGACTNPTATAGTVCGDNSNLCVGAKLCDGSGACVQGAPPVVDNSNPCVVGICDPATGVHYANAPSGTACGTSANACVGPYACNGAGTCVQGAAPVVDDGNPCTADTCDPASGVSHTPTPGVACGDDTNKCATTYVCDAAAACQTVAPPVLDDGNWCTTDACDTASGAVSHTTVAGCDPNPVTSTTYEDRASILGTVVTTAGAPVTGVTIAVYDDSTDNAARSDVVVTSSADGTFRARLTTFPTTVADNAGPQHVILRISSATSLPAYRAADLMPGVVKALGTIRVVARDTKVTTIDETGGTATDSQGLVQVVVPAGAVSGPTDFVITPFASRADLPAKLPTATLPGLAMALEPSGITFAHPVTVRQKNTRNLPTTMTIPVGQLDARTLRWHDAAQATWDGQYFAYTIQDNIASSTGGATSHARFRPMVDPGPGDPVVRDTNPSQAGEWIAIFGQGKNPYQGDQKCNVGSSAGFANGTLRQHFGLPGVQRRGATFAVGLNYDSMSTLGTDQATSTGSGGTRPPPSTIIASVPGPAVSLECVPRGQAEADLAASPGSCGGGSCSPGVRSPLPTGTRMTGSVDATPIAVDPSGNTVEFDTSYGLQVPLTDAQDVAPPGFVSTSVALVRAGITCAAAQSLFDAPSTERGTTGVNYDPGEPTPIGELDQSTFLYHRRSTPFGAGWGIDGLSQLYKDPSADLIVTVSGGGEVEKFYPRTRPVFLQTHGFEDLAAALDPQTHELFEMDNVHSGIFKVNPTDGSTTSVIAGVSVTPYAMAIAYVNGTRHFLVAGSNKLLDVDAAGNQRQLTTRTLQDGGVRFLLYTPAVAVVGEYAYYVSGLWATPVLYRFHLTDAAPAAEAISLLANGDKSISPVGTVGAYTFGDPHGLAAAPDGSGLFISDRVRNSVFKIGLDATGVVSAQSLIAPALGDGGGHVVAPVGTFFHPEAFSIPQPGPLTVGPDGVVWVATEYGAATFDPANSKAEWMLHDQNIAASESMFSLYDGGQSGRAQIFVPIGPNTLFWDNAQNVFRLEIDRFSSETDPTRTIAWSGTTGSLLTDTTSDLVEAYDPTGRLLERRTREGDLLESFHYDGASGTLLSRVDPLGGATTFSYSGGVLQSITDAAGRTTLFAIDAHHDLTSFTQPDGEVWTFTYDEHRMTSKRSQVTGDVTTYTYGDKGVFTSATKPNGETTTLTKPAYAQTPTQDANGGNQYTTTYMDAHGVTHTVTFDRAGRTVSDAYTADGVPYTVQHERPTYVGEFEAHNEQRRRNRLLGREARLRVNGVVVGFDNAYDTMGRWFGDQTQTPGSGRRDFVDYNADGRIADYNFGDDIDHYALTYDANGRPSRRQLYTSNGLVRQDTFAWTTDGQLATLNHDDVWTTTFGYDTATGNLASTSDTVGQTSAYQYDAAGSVTSANDGTTTWTYAHDANGRLTTATDALGNATTIGYVQQTCGCSIADLATTIHTPDLAAGKTWTLGYEKEGRLASVTDPDGHAETYAYEPTGELKTRVDRNGHTTAMTHDQLGRVITMVDALGRMHNRTYTHLSNGAYAGQDMLAGSADNSAAPTGVSQAPGVGQYQLGTNAYDLFNAAAGPHTRGWSAVELYRDATLAVSHGRTYDGNGRTTRVADRPLSAITAGSSDPLPTGAGAVLNVQSTHSNQFGGLNLSLDDYATSTSGFGETDITGEPDISYVNSTVGSTGGDAPGAHESYGYDNAHRLTSATLGYHNILTSGRLDLTRTYSYWPNGKLKTSPEGSFTYDARGLLQTRQITVNGTTETYAYAYDALGRNTLLTYPDGHTRQQQFDNEGHITSRCYVATDQSSRCYTADYDPAGNPVHMGDPEGADRITYDALDRVVQVVRTGSGAPAGGQVEAYAYNALGALQTNASSTLDDQRYLLGATSGPTAPSAIPGTYNGAPITVDNAGQIASLAGLPLSFAKGDLVAVGTGHLFYDRFDRVAASTLPGTTTALYTYDGANRTGVWNGGTQVDGWIYGGVDHPLEHWDSNGNKQYFELDLAGNVRRVRGTNGADLGGYRYTAFGAQVTDGTAPAAPQGANSLPVRWKGRWLMYASGVGTAGAVELYDMRARWWWPQGGVFVSVDGFEFNSPRTTPWSWPGLNPLKYWDPTGHDWSLDPLEWSDGIQTIVYAAGAYAPGILATAQALAAETGQVELEPILGAGTIAIAAIDASYALPQAIAADLAVQDNEYSREAKANAGSRGNPFAELDKIREKLRQAGSLTAETERKLNQAEKYLGGRNRKKREECK